MGMPSGEATSQRHGYGWPGFTLLRPELGHDLIMAAIAGR
jgi:hypothetical protein